MQQVKVSFKRGQIKKKTQKSNNKTTKNNIVCYYALKCLIFFFTYLMLISLIKHVIEACVIFMQYIYIHIDKIIIFKKYQTLCKFGSANSANLYLDHNFFYFLVYCLHTLPQQPLGQDLSVDHTNLDLQP
jgi:hypothetical protein